MTTVATRARAIAALEGFDIIVTRKGKRVDPAKNGLLVGSYPFEKMLKHTKTAANFKHD